ncbi:hypothetical protein [Chitinophaga defluvii]|uniref:Uncharacterized protein n=1 Tax=Chitinophaga defluvii TaxID=3163343 RepID=A0ABV2T8S7_9BACT
MENGMWPYALIIEGHYAQGKLYEGKYLSKPIIELRYFGSAEEAFQSLVREEFHQFDKRLESPVAHPVCYDTAVINDTRTGAKLTEVNIISIDDVPDASPPAGIYLGIADELGFEGFQSIANIDLSRFGDYDPDVPFFLLARYKYDEKGLGLIPQKGLKDLQLFSKDIFLSREKSLFILNVKECYLDVLQGEKNTQYHFDSPKAAFAALLSTNMQQLDSRISDDRNFDTYIKEIGIYSVKGHPLVELKNVKNLPIDKNAAEPGIYLNFPEGLGHFESEFDIDVSGLRDYAKGSRYQLLHHYDDTFSEIVPTEGFNKLKETLQPVEKIQPSLEKGHYEIKYEWDSLTDVPIQPNFYRQVALTKHETVAGAFEELQAINSRLFDVRHAIKMQESGYLKEATIYQNATPILTKFNAQEDLSLPPDLRYKIDLHTVTVDLIRELYPYMAKSEQVSTSQMEFSLKDVADSATGPTNIAARKIENRSSEGKLGL